MEQGRFGDEFVAAAQAAFNAQDLDAAMKVYAPGATLEMWTDGVYHRFVGTEEIRSAWKRVFAIYPRFELRKSLVSADARSLVNDWHGSADGTRRGFGLDLWEFDDRGDVTAHRVVSFADVRPADSVAGRLRWMLFQPVDAIRRARAAEREVARGR